MRILVTGASGMLGSAIVEQWRDKHEVYATGGSTFTAPAGWSYRAFDLAAPEYGALVDWARPEVIVHCAAITLVDACESAPERTLEINGRSVDRLLRAAPGVRMLFISSDAVFGHRTAPVREDTRPAPLNVYGRSKLLGETLLADRDAGVAVRTTVVGWNRDPGKQSFVEWIVRTIERKAPITLFEDALFNPIASVALADALELLLASPFRGTLHISGRDSISKHAFGLQLCARLGLDAQLIAAGRIGDMHFTAPRAADQRLDVSTFEGMFARQLPTTTETIDALARGYRELRS